MPKTPQITVLAPETHFWGLVTLEAWSLWVLLSYLGTRVLGLKITSVAESAQAQTWSALASQVRTSDQILNLDPIRVQVPE